VGVIFVFRKLIREVEKRPGIPFTVGAIFGLSVSIYLGRKLVLDIEKRETS
jgi:hypothetical protein